MNLREAFDFVAAQREPWKDGKNWAKPFCYNREHILRLMGADKNVKKITKADLAAMRAKLVSEGRAPGGTNRIMSMLNTLLKDLVENEIIDKQPRLKPLKENNERKTFFTRQNIDQMVKVSKEVYGNNELADAITFAVFTGCRQAELLKLTVGDVQLEKDLIIFRDTKNGEDHILDIHPDMKEMLSMRCANESPSEKVFQFSNKDELWSAFKKVRRLCDIGTDHVWHTLRHTTGTWLAEKGVPIQTIAKVLNHKQISTSQRYVKVTDKARSEAINCL